MTIINADRTARAKDYEGLAMNQLLVYSMFYTLQGEGPFAGRPAIFLRLAGCNYGAKKDVCQFCDTAFQVAKGKVMTFGEILFAADQMWKTRCKKPFPRLMVITGGEPFLQPTLTNFCVTATHPDYPGSERGFAWTVQIESNGSIPNPPALDMPDEVMLVVSPKAPHAFRPGEYPPMHKFYKDRANVFKFLIEDNPNSPYYLPPQWALEAAVHQPIYLSPIAVYNASPISGDSDAPNEVASFWDPALIDQGACHRNHLRAAQLCMVYGLRMSIQMHLLATIP
jgi:7-carboxy-7-deazaguanine synthase